MIAGPSEILIVADGSAKPAFLAADLMSQAEHDKRASAILLTTSDSVARATAKEIEKQIKYLERQEIIEASLNDYGEIIVCENLDQAIEFANELAPEHLELCVEEPLTYIGKVDNAGSVFLGNWSPEPLGDYFAGPNHVLPTSGTARFFSPLSVDSFVKKSSFIPSRSLKRQRIKLSPLPTRRVSPLTQTVLRLDLNEKNKAFFACCYCSAVCRVPQRLRLVRQAAR